MPYGLFDYVPGSNIHTMGQSTPVPNTNFITTAMIGSEAPPQVTTKMAWGEETPPNVTTPKPPGGSGGCPPGYAPTPPGDSPPPGGIPPGTPTTMAAICSENAAFCNNFTIARPVGEEMIGTGLTNDITDGFVGSEEPAPYTPPGGWGAYNPYTRATTGNEDIRNYPAEQAKQNALYAQMEQKRTEYGQTMPGAGIYTAPGGAYGVEEKMMGEARYTPR